MVIDALALETTSGNGGRRAVRMPAEKVRAMPIEFYDDTRVERDSPIGGIGTQVRVNADNWHTIS